MLLQILVISLKHSVDRREKVVAEMKKTKLAWQFLDAVDGSKLDLSTTPYFPNRVKRLLGFELTPKELGCYLSHMKAWNLCIDNKISTLVFEDDFVLSDSFEKTLSTFLSEYQDWDIVRLQALCDIPDRILKDFKEFRVVQNMGDPLGATAYLINPRSAGFLIKHSSEIFEPLDHYIEHVEKHAMKMYAIKPYPVSVSDPSGASTTIGDRPERMPIRGFSKLKRSVFRSFDRLSSRNPYFPK